MLKVHGEGVASFDSAELEYHKILVASITQLKIFNRCHADAPTKVQNKCSKLRVPPRRTILQSQKPKVTWSYSLNTNFGIVLPSVALEIVLLRRTMLELLESSEIRAYGLYEIFPGTRCSRLVPPVQGCSTLPVSGTKRCSGVNPPAGAREAIRPQYPRRQIFLQQNTPVELDRAYCAIKI